MGSIDKSAIEKFKALLNEYVARPIPQGETDSLVVLDATSSPISSGLSDFADWLNQKNLDE